jgi:GTP cyclohydrolase II
MRQLEVRSSVPVPIEGTALETRCVTFKGLHDEHFAICIGRLQTARPILVRLHSECVTGDIFGSRRCDCGPQLREAITTMDRHGSGVILYLRQEGRGIGLYAKLEAYLLQDAGMDTFRANQALGFADDLRDFSEAALMQALGIHDIDLLTNNPDKAASLRASGIRIQQQIPTQTYLTKHNFNYLKSKADKKLHTIDITHRD